MLIKWKNNYWLSILLLLMYANATYAQINVFACEPEWAALTKALAGNAAKIYSATTALQDPHHVQARPSLIAKVRRADLLVCTGAELEVGWLPLLLRKSGNAKIQPNNTGYFMASNYVTLLEKPAVLDRRLGDIHASGNPHIHLDPRRILKIAKALTVRLAKVDPENANLYKKNGLIFQQNWKQAIKQWEQKFKALQGKRIVVSHNSWIYLEQWLGLKKVATLEPKPGIAPSSAHLSKILNELKQNPADMILYASYQNDQSARWLSQKTGLATVALAFTTKKNESLTQWFDTLLNQLLRAGL